CTRFGNPYWYFDVW
nr:immunoglobulin heavy chain junction region [Mus musculus]MBK4186407.1 immunoglobulin heavy chain junction region [Mus musculus]